MKGLFANTSLSTWLLAGLVASVADYLRFAEMLLHSGQYGNTRLLAPHTVKLMTSDALPPL